MVAILPYFHGIQYLPLTWHETWQKLGPNWGQIKKHGIFMAYENMAWNMAKLQKHGKCHVSRVKWQLLSCISSVWSYNCGFVPISTQKVYTNAKNFNLRFLLRHRNRWIYCISHFIFGYHVHFISSVLGVNKYYSTFWEISQFRASLSSNR